MSAADRRERLQVAFEHATIRYRRENADASVVIAELIEHHGATYRPRWDTNRLSVAGVSSSCTWSADKGLLQNWLDTAGLRLMQLAGGTQ